MPERDPPVGTDPGGAHAKGYSAERTDEAKVPPTGPLPLADAPPGAKATHPEYDGDLPPTGRTEPDESEGGDRIGTRL